MQRQVVAILAAAMVLATAAPWAAETAIKVPKPGKEGWVLLFDGKKGLDGWHAQDKRPERNRWKAVGDELHNTQNGGSNLISDVKLMDQELFIQFQVPRGGNSGVYLQGRYEVQVGDSHGRKPSRGACGAIYGKIEPKEIAALAVGDDGWTPWQTYQIKFHSARLDADGNVAKKARITVVQNGKLIIDDGEIDGLTGGAVDRKEGTPAGLMLQGDHTRVRYRNIMYRPIKGE